VTRGTGAWLGGSWQTLVTQSSQQSSESSFYLAYIVALHCATALALMWFFRADWIRIIRGFFRSLPASARLSLQERRLRLAVADKDERLAWMIIFATIPVGLTGVALEHTFRVLFAKPAAAATLLFVNGADPARRRSPAAVRDPAEAGRRSGCGGPSSPGIRASGHPVDSRRRHTGAGSRPRVSRWPCLRYPGTPRDPGYPANPGLPGNPGVPGNPGYRGYPNVPGHTGAQEYPRGAERATVPLPAGAIGRLATPVILAAGVLKVPSLLGPAGAHIHGQVVIGVIVCGIAAYLSVRFLVRWFQTRTLTPFAVYCLAFGALSILRFL
jgi:undecaprenyl-diphosphatase